MRSAVQNLKIAHRLALAACSFAIPVAFILWALVSEQDIAIAFAAKESAGAAYLGDLAAIQAREAEAALGRTDPSALAAGLRQAEATWGQGLQTASMAGIAASALEKPGNLADARAKLRSLIVRVGDKSNLILDNVLDTYYLGDVVLNRLPDAMDQLADLTGQAAAIKPADTDGRVQLLIGVGTLIGDLDGADASLQSAEAVDGGDKIAAALDKPYATLAKHLHDFAATLKGVTAAASAQDLIGQAGAFSQAADGELHDLLRVFVITCALFGAAILLVLGNVLNGVTRPLRSMLAATTALAAGDLETQIPPAGATNEIGDMNRALREFQARLIEARDMAAERNAEAATQIRRAAMLEALSLKLEAQVGNVAFALSSASGALTETATSMSVAADQTTRHSRDVAAAAAEASSLVMMTSAAAEQFTASIGEITRQVAQSSRRTEKAVEDVRRTDGIVRALSEGADRIGQVVGLISSIAAQTNLLALNATIEAARAGDAGRGFAVVASEVKSLAQQTAKATGDISAQIAQMRTATEDAVGAISLIAQSIEEMGIIASTIAASVGEQGQAAGEIAGYVHRAANSTGEVSTSIAGVSAAAASTSTGAVEVLGSAGKLSEQSEMIVCAVGEFVAGIRAA